MDTVGSTFKGLLDDAVLVAVETAIHGGREDIGRVFVPLVHNHALLAGDGAVVAWLAGLIGAHGPTSILLVRGDGNEVGVVGGKSAGTTLDEGRDGAGGALKSSVLLLVQVRLSAGLVVKVSVKSGSVNGGRETKGERQGAGFHCRELHSVGGVVCTRQSIEEQE